MTFFFFFWPGIMPGSDQGLLLDLFEDHSWYAWGIIWDAWGSNWVGYVQGKHPTAVIYLQPKKENWNEYWMIYLKVNCHTSNIAWFFELSELLVEIETWYCFVWHPVHISVVMFCFCVRNKSRNYCLAFLMSLQFSTMFICWHSRNTCLMNKY